MRLCGDKEDMKMTVDSELNRLEIYKVLNTKSTGWGTRNPILLVAKDIGNLEKERLKNIEFFDESIYTPVVLEDINTIRKIFNYNFRDMYYLFDFFEGVDMCDINKREINELCREMREEIERQEAERTLNELETGRAVIRTNSIETMSEDYARRLYEQFSSCQSLTEVSEITVTDENRANVRGTWFV